MTVGELKETLQQYPENLEIGFAYSHGDYWYTEVVGKVNAVEELDTIHSAYHNLPKLVEDSANHDPEEITQMLVIQ